MAYSNPEGRLVTVGITDLGPQAPRQGKIVVVGRVYDQHDQSLNPDTKTPQGNSWERTSLLVETEAGITYFGRPAIPGIRHGHGIFVNITKALSGRESPPASAAYKLTGRSLEPLTVGEAFFWGDDQSDQVSRIIAISPEDLLVTESDQKLPYPFDDTVAEINTRLMGTGLAKTAWALGTKCLELANKENGS